MLPKINKRPEFLIAKGSFIRVLRDCNGHIVGLRNEGGQVLTRRTGKQRKFFDFLVENLLPV